jgi:hypothetical protein
VTIHSGRAGRSPRVPCQTPAVRLAPPALTSAAALVALAALALSCGDDGPGDTARFCAEVKAHTAELVTPPKELADVAAFVGLYKRIDRVAPLAVQPHWEALILNYETASTVDPGDPASLQRAYRQAYATEASAVKVHDFLLTNCGVDIGPVSTIVPQTTAPAATSTTQPG